MKNRYTLQKWAFGFCLLFSVISFNAFGQVGIGTTNPNATLDVVGTDSGILIPRIALTATNSIAPIDTPTTSELIYNTASAGSGINAVTPGYYYWNGSLWVRVADASTPSNDWSRTGNAGTIPGTSVGQNYLGTTDNQNLIIATAGTQRMRLLSNGQIVLNNIGAPIAGDRLTVQGANNEFTINGYASGATGVGVYGENATTNAIGVFGNVAVGFGVYGQSTGVGIGVDGYNPASGMGVRGLSDGTGIGVGGYNTSSGTAVYGWNQGSGNGVRGDAANSENGVRGQNTGTGNAVYGITNNAAGYGVRSFHLNATGTSILATGNNANSTFLASGTGIASNGSSGMFSYGRVATGTGIIGTGNNSVSIITNPNGGGVAGSGTRNGIFGYAGLGAVTNGNRGNAAGIFLLDTDNNVANNSASNDNGIRASAVIAGFDNIAFTDDSGTQYSVQDSYFGGYFSGGTERTGSVATTPSYAYVGLRYDTSSNGRTGNTDFKIVGPGNVSTIINDEKNVPRIMFAPEAPEIVFQDYGIGQLVNGQAYIELDPVLKKSLHIDSEHPLKVFITLEGDCKGVYVTNKSANGFIVKELQNGTSNVPFSWQIVANRADTKDINGNIVSKHVGLRLPEGPGPLHLTAKNNESMTNSEINEIKTSQGSQLQDLAKKPIKSKDKNSSTDTVMKNIERVQTTLDASEVSMDKAKTTSSSDILFSDEQ